MQIDGKVFHRDRWRFGPRRRHGTHAGRQAAPRCVIAGMQADKGEAVARDIGGVFVEVRT